MKLETFKLSGLVVAIAGGIASGKSTLCTLIAEQFLAKNKHCNIISYDQIRSYLLSKVEQAEQADVQSKLADQFGSGIFKAKGQIDRRYLSKLIFSSAENLCRYNQILNPAIINQVLLHQNLSSDLQLLEWPTIIESNLLELCSNNVILLKCTPSVQYQRLCTQSQDQQHIFNIIRQQISSKEREALLSQLDQDGGSFIEVLDSTTGINLFQLSTLINKLDQLCFNYKQQNLRNCLC